MRRRDFIVVLGAVTYRSAARAQQPGTQIVGFLNTRSHDPSSGACSGAALSRIQSAVTSAEDDLRQLNDLSARTQKLQKQLQKK